MTKEFKDKWIAALRSGEYKQCECQLQKGQSYCCLGVACVIAGNEIPHPELIELVSPIYFIDDSFKGVPSELIGDEGLPGTLSRLNDQGNSFECIADWIEKNIEI